MDNIYIDYEQGLVLGRKIQKEADDLMTLLHSIKEVQEKLQPILKDSNDEKYLNNIINQTKFMDKLAETIEETGNFLVDVSTAYQDVAENGPIA